MPSNNTGKIVKDLYKKYPDKIALLLNPQCYRPHQFEYPYAVDNNAFVKFNEKMFFDFLIKTKKHKPPMWVVCPDVVGCHDRTNALWWYYYPKIKLFGYKVAFVAQNGCEPDKIPDEANVIFIGGTDPWKTDNIHKFVGNGKPVHVGRVNGVGRLKYCESLGVASVDGTGWMMAGYRQKQFISLFEGDNQQCLF